MTAVRSKIRTDRYLEQAIVQLFTLKLTAGTSLKELQRLAARCLDQVRLTSHNTTGYQGLGIHRLGSVLRAWHKETKYLTFDGLPRPLKTEGKNGLKSLVCRFYDAKKFDEVLRRLVDAKLVRQSGSHTWLPTGRTARISQQTRETLEHLAEGVARYVETVTRNVTAQDEDDVLFERSCKVSRLPASQLQAFREYVDQQAISFLTTVDDWLESRNAPIRKASSRTYIAGVHAFAYIAGRGKLRRLAGRGKRT